MEELSERWRPWRSIGCYYMWRLCEVGAYSTAPDLILNYPLRPLHTSEGHAIRDPLQLSLWPLMSDERYAIQLELLHTFRQLSSYIIHLMCVQDHCLCPTRFNVSLAVFRKQITSQNTFRLIQSSNLWHQSFLPHGCLSAVHGHSCMEIRGR